jgi:hypothetical protein
MTAPQRVQRKRTKGWRMPERAIYVGRPSPVANPFRVGVDGDAAECVAKFREWIHGTSWEAISAYDTARGLRGWDLCCWCRLDQPCHADVLLEIANA